MHERTLTTLYSKNHIFMHECAHHIWIWVNADKDWVIVRNWFINKVVDLTSVIDVRICLMSNR